MAITVIGKNYSQYSSCDTTTSGGTWSLMSVAQDLAVYKEGTASLCFICKTSGDNIFQFAPTTAKDLSGTKHLRFWFISVHGGILNVYNPGEASYGGLSVGVTDGTNTGWWRILGKDTYPGGWINCVIDVSKACDLGTKPTNMNAITIIYFKVNLTGTGKQAANTWVDNLCVCDGLTAYGDDAGGYFDFDDIFNADNATTLGIGILRKIGGQFFSTGSIEIGYATNATKFQSKSQVLIFENRRVNDALYNITVVDSGNASYTTEFILGSKAGTAGVEGCMIRVQDSTQTCKFNIDGGTDTDVDNFKLYGSTFYDASTLKFPLAATGMTSVHRARSSNVATIGCNAHGLIVGNTTVIANLGGTGYNGTWTVASVVDADHFTYANTGDNESETSDTSGTITSMNAEVLNCNFESCDEVMATTCVIKYCNFVSANDEAIVLPSGNIHQMEYCSFISNGDAVRITVAGTYTCSGNKFYGLGNNVDIDNTSGGSVIVNCVNNSDAVTYTGSTSIYNTKILKVTCKNEAGYSVGGVRVRIEKVSDESLITEGETNSSGIYQYDSYNYTGEISVRIKARLKGYKNNSAIDAINNNGLSVPFTMGKDPAVNLP